MDIPGLINAVYNRKDGDLLYREVVQHLIRYFGRSLHSEEEAMLFADEFLRRCAPAAAAAEINLSALATLAAKIISATKTFDLFNRDEVINFIHRSLVRKI